MHEQTGYPASTLHSAMGIIYDADLSAQEYELLTADLVIVDECSMVDMRLAYALFQRLKPGAQLILVGDPGSAAVGGAGQCAQRNDPQPDDTDGSAGHRVSAGIQ